MITLRHRKDAKRRRRPSLRVGAVILGAARAGRRHPWQILGVAVTVSAVTVLLEIVAKDVIDRSDVSVSLTVDLSSTAVSILGTVFLSGFLCRLVGAAEHGRRGASIAEVARSLPWWRLVRADLLVVLFTTVGIILLIIPGLVALVLLAIAGPVIELEDRPVWAALRRSAHLVRPYFWKVALLTLPLMIAGSEVESIAPHPDGPGTIVAALVVRALGEAVAEAALGLVLVELGYQLMACDRRRSAGDGQQHEAGPEREAGPGQEAGRRGSAR